MVPEERTVRCDAAGLGPERRTQEREAGPRWVTLQGSTTVAPTTAVRFKVDGPRNLGGRVGITCRQCCVNVVNVDTLVKDNDTDGQAKVERLDQWSFLPI